MWTQCRWWLPLFGLLTVWIPSVLGEPFIPNVRRGGVYTPILPPLPAERPSHLPLDAQDVGDLEELLAGRLSQARVGELTRKNKAEADAARKAVQSLLKNRKFMESLDAKFTPEDLESLQSRLARGEIPANDGVLRDLIEQAQKNNTLPDLSEIDQKRFQRWLETNPKLPELGWGDGRGRPTISPLGPPPSVPPSITPPTPQPSPSPQPGSRAETPDWLKKRFEGFIKSLDDNVDSPDGNSWNEFLGRMAQEGSRSRALDPDFLEKVQGWSQKLPKMERSPGDLGRWFRTTRSPNLRQGGMALHPPTLPATPSSPTISGRGAEVIVWVVLFVVVVLVLLRVGWRVVRDRLAPSGEWRLGPWPVRPQAVATRADLVRAFEYLALLLLGPAARTRHHLDLAEQIGTCPGEDPTRRRQAAEELARLYAVARYAPDDTPLQPEDLASARRDLCYLAGVSPA